MFTVIFVLMKTRSCMGILTIYFAFKLPIQYLVRLRDEERALPLAAAAAACVAFATVAAVGISLGIVFPDEPADRPFCRERRMLEALPAAASSREEEPEAYRYRGGAFYMTTAEAADFYWMVVLVPSAVLFAASAAYLVSGESVLVLFVVMLRFLWLQC